MRVGGDVEILRLEAGQDVANAAADDVGLEAGVLERVQDLERRAREIRA